MIKKIVYALLILCTMVTVDCHAEKFVIRKTWDLEGGIFELPANSTLRFKKNGKIINGEIIGKNTKIIASKKRVFENIKITGTWNNEIVYSDWLDFSFTEGDDNYNNFKNLMAFCNDSTPQTVYIANGVYWTSTKSQEEALLIPSNTRLVNEGSIFELPNSYEQCALSRISKSENVEILGGFYYGDVESHLGTTGEWSHGILCEGSKNIKIENVVCNDFWGDGIDIIEAYDENRKPTLICYNIRIDNAICFFNRRQGISLEAVMDCVVANSNFSYTGTKKYTRPADGIDIEAWNSVGEKLKNITIYNCTMVGNIGKSISIFANGPLLKDYELYKNNILIEDCTMNDVFATCSYGIEYKNCEMDSRMYQYVTDLKYTNCIINGVNVTDSVTNRWK